MKLKDGAKGPPPTGSGLQLSSFNFKPPADHTIVFLNNALLETGNSIHYDGGAKEE